MHVNAWYEELLEKWVGLILLVANTPPAKQHIRCCIPGFRRLCKTW